MVVRGSRAKRRHVVDVAPWLEFDNVTEAPKHVARLRADLTTPGSVAIQAEDINEGEAIRRTVVRLRGDSQMRKGWVGCLKGGFDPAQVLGTLVCMLHSMKSPSFEKKLGRIDLWRKNISCSLEATDYATLEWVNWLTDSRIPEPIGHPVSRSQGQVQRHSGN